MLDTLAEILPEGKTMKATQDIQDTAKIGADSVFEYIERIAEVIPDGVRWETLSYENKLQYAVSASTGVSGISLFLSDYYRLTGLTKARDLALGANQWCSAPERNIEEEDLGAGRAGIGMAWLRFAKVTNDSKALAKASEIADILLKLNPGPVSAKLARGHKGVQATDFYRGAAGEGIFLIRLWEMSGEDRYLSGAVRNGEWLSSVATRDEMGCYWPIYVSKIDDPPPSGKFLGFCHGIAGIGYFLVLLYQATKDSHWVELIHEIDETLSKRAIPDLGGLSWPRFIGDPKAKEKAEWQWCHGSAGIGLFYTKAYEVMSEEYYLKTAKAAGETTFAYGDFRNSPIQCHGLSGNAELFIELYRLTQDNLWLERARDFATRIFSYRITSPEGYIWQIDGPGLYSPDFLCGAAGIGHFYLRLGASDQLRMPLL